MFAHPLHYGAAQSTYDRAVLYGNDAVVAVSDFLQYLLIDGFEEYHIVVSHIYALRFGFFNGMGNVCTYVANAEYGRISITIAEFATFANGNELHRASPIYDFARNGR